MNETIEQYLIRRIAELNKADASFCEDRWNMSKPNFERATARECSNQVTMARQELEQVLKACRKKNKITQALLVEKLFIPFPLERQDKLQIFSLNYWIFEFGASNIPILSIATSTSTKEYIGGYEFWEDIAGVITPVDELRRGVDAEIKIAKELWKDNKRIDALRSILRAFPIFTQVQAKEYCEKYFD